MPDGVLGFRVGGTLTKADYTDVLIPALQGGIEGGEGLRLVVVIEQDFERMEPGAIWEDVKTAVGYELQAPQRLEAHRRGERHRLDRPHASTAFGWLAPGELRVFGRGELDAAVAWAAG